MGCDRSSNTDYERLSGNIFSFQVLIRFLLLLTTWIYTQYHPQEWGSITSLLSPTGVQIAENGTVYASTSGGLLQFNPLTAEFNFIKMEEGLIYLDLSTVEIDSQGRLWLGGAYPNGYLQVYDPDKGLVCKINYLEAPRSLGGTEIVTRSLIMPGHQS